MQNTVGSWIRQLTRNSYAQVIHILPRGHGGQVERCRPRTRKVPNPIPLNIRLVLGLLQVRSYIGGQMPFAGVIWKFGEGRLRCRPRHMIAVQNYNVRLKIALVLLKTGC
ncbi:hypothetical protein AVEN_31490-1 [Araneus ventricosus]|uniref:Uncharacterized protein n=1 Tax=Araneus ventricosus TaxID=182803 RepID=A0A4Y2UPT3_ARAVE|nr:hypothetical protein AVEN_168806-1 [Araneus ventricosus]GBO15082.1 hypothetical protein AVEN_31490-1 [Araneus ventricosus]